MFVLLEDLSLFTSVGVVLGMVLALKISVAFKISIILDVFSWSVMVVSGRDVFCSSSFVYSLFSFFT